MTDKIIIDGVDVSGCEFYNHTYCDLGTGNLTQYKDKNGNCTFCEIFKDCYYKQCKRKEEEYNKWKSYYDLYRQNQTLLKRIQGIINSHPEYGIELTETGIIDKDERLSCLETDEQIKLIFTEYEEQLQAEKEKVEELKNRLAVANFEIENLRECRAPSMECLNRYTQALEEIKGIAESSIVYTPEYNNCYYKDECGVDCTPKKEKKKDVCLYEQIDKIIEKCEVLNV